MKDAEIEIKIQLKNPRHLMLWLKKNCKFIGAFDQVDYYFDPPHKTFISKNKKGLKTANDYLRIRVGEKKSSICFKRLRIHKSKHGAFLDEFETEIGDPQKLRKAFDVLGFKQTAVIKKHRESYLYKNFQFDCDRVESLGYFVEIEFKGRVKSPEEGFQKILDLLEGIGIRNWTEAKNGYVQMFWNKK